nr:STAS domain-containing protein [Variovorax boronicumulans]
MAQDTPPPGGLLSKVVKFVRNPTVNWSELDQLDERDSQYNKHVLKEMIERKRANDFVRKREFDQLRKLRQRGTAGASLTPLALDDSGFFDSSQPASAGQREGTLKKIDEIEAQMAHPQWQPPRDAAPAPQFSPTVNAEPQPVEARVTDFAATDVQPREALLADAAPEDMLPDVDWSLGASAQGGDFVADPGLEEAAIRFANGDDAGCEAALLALAQAQTPVPLALRAWAALFDLYRATAQQGRFEAMAVDFQVRHQRQAPAWSAIGGPGRAGSSSDAPLAWAAPALLDAAQVTALAVQVAGFRGDTVQLDWGALDAVQPPALGPLADLLSQLADRPLRVSVRGNLRLEQLLRHHTVSGQRAQPVAWWRLRLAWLRLTQRPEEFDLVALDYCITYEVAPPAWEDAQCSLVGPQDSGPGTAPAGQAMSPAARLAGVVSGDAHSALATVAVPSGAGLPLVVDCADLVRIDFAAAGSVLNWAAAQQAAGQRLEFRGLHRLVAIFFYVIGLADHATLVPRSH